VLGKVVRINTDAQTLQMESGDSVPYDVISCNLGSYVPQDIIKEGKEAPLDKVGVYAVRQNPIIYHNLMAALEGTEPQTVDPDCDYLLIFTLGNGTGIIQKRWILFGGRLAFTVKDYIDRKFMRKFQAIE
jgi:NADH dehydrogenase FAD-containing subunit